MDPEQRSQKDPDPAGPIRAVSAPGRSSAPSKSANPAAPASAPQSTPATAQPTGSATAPVSAPQTAPASAQPSGSATTAATAPVTATANIPATAPTTGPTTARATTPATAPATAPVTAPATTPGTARATTPATTPATAPVTAPATTPATAPVTAPATTPATAPVTANRARKLERAPRAQSSTEPKPTEATQPPAAPSKTPHPRPPGSGPTPSAAKPPEPTPAKGPPGPSPNPNVRPHPLGSRSPFSTRAASVPHPPPTSPVPPHLSPHPQRAFSVAGTADTQPQPVEDFRVHIITWNVGSAVPPDDIISLLGLNVSDGNTDMYIIGLQEVNSMINKRLKDVLFTDQWSELCMDTLSPFGYVLVTSQRMQGVLLLVFAKYYHLPFLRGVQTESTRTGLGGYWGNKGGVSARMTVFGHSVCFLNCHLPAHMENSEQRMDDFDSILQQQQFEGQAASGVLDHDVVFWFGDLNFRIEDYEMHVVKGAIDNNRLSLLWEKDQLNMAKDSEQVLEGFHEGPLKFPPTYKFDVGTHTYDTSGKKRKPAWTDRILWRLRAAAPPGPPNSGGPRRSPTAGLTSGTRVTQHFYRSHMEYTVSDHKPVSSLFTLQFPYKVDIPLVTLTVEDEWNQVSDAKAKFKMAANYSRSSWDWIGLYKVGFKHHKDYAAYVWAKQEESDYLTQEYQVTFDEEDLPKGSGDYILGYYSNNMSSIVGVTEPFQIQLPTSSPEASPSDSSYSSAEEEGAGGALLRPTSRSPSPGGSKTRRRSRSRSPALAKLQGLRLTSRSPSPRPPARKKKERRGDTPDGLLSPAASSPPASSSAMGALVTAISGEQLSALAADPAAESGETGSSS
ncbi:phosphatidylinositol 4,5-bisphosphate 5-phosphatase A isoform X3 [Anguilla anguilla]|uniref:phosphatidylinositol 4,5-bisphosphate 5-phosphatase A isoform X2 n=1 Tax=Anguilla anguilla TaxID=7936 RepID=UPI0015AAA9E2|nr:phosphatidylinositol 4,5-bisphosphate 5-phosphatase A isoform X2 [Anguilla anguilla]XP_035236154.1 phosphatidylinositol 4,5-bisphosphate 5-phosphatase A isoform X3 [Anguilla anguilla]